MTATLESEHCLPYMVVKLVRRPRSCGVFCNVVLVKDSGLSPTQSVWRSTFKCPCLSQNLLGCWA